MVTRKHVKRVSYAKQREKCRLDGSAFYETVEFKDDGLNTTTTFRLLMCNRKGMGGQCMPKKCKDMRVIAELMDVLREMSLEGKTDGE